MIISRTSTRCDLRHLSLGLFVVLALPFPTGRASAIHEQQPNEVGGQYILSLNLVAAGNFVANPLDAPPGAAALFGPFQTLFNRQRLVTVGRSREETLSTLWQNATWRALFIETAEEVWEGVVEDHLLVEPIERGPTSALIELDASALAELSSVVNSPNWVATTADKDRALPLILQPNYRLTPTRIPNDPLFPAQWALHKTGVPSAWDKTVGSPPVMVALIDSGYDEDQIELRRNLWPGNANTKFNPGLGFCEENRKLKPPQPCDAEDIKDETGHGTAMAGIVGAQTNDELRVAGTNWSVSLMILKVLGGDNRGSVWDIAKAIRFAADNGARIISLSLGGRPDHEDARGELLAAIIYASGRNQTGQASQSLVVVAAGNENLDLSDPNKSVIFPASFKVTHSCEPDKWCFENLIVVGATDRNDERASFSNYGVKVVDLGAPGVEVLSTGLEKNWGVAEVTGTSASTALVAGAAALVEASRLPPCNPGSELCYVDLKRRLLERADLVLDLCEFFDKGRRLNVDRAVRDAGASPSCPP